MCICIRRFSHTTDFSKNINPKNKEFSHRFFMKFITFKGHRFSHRFFIGFGHVLASNLELLWDPRRPKIRKNGPKRKRLSPKSGSVCDLAFGHCFGAFLATTPRLDNVTDYCSYSLVLTEIIQVSEFVCSYHFSGTLRIFYKKHEVNPVSSFLIFRSKTASKSLNFLGNPASCFFNFEPM